MALDARGSNSTTEAISRALPSLSSGRHIPETMQKNVMTNQVEIDRVNAILFDVSNYDRKSKQWAFYFTQISV